MNKSGHTLIQWRSEDTEVVWAQELYAAHRGT